MAKSLNDEEVAARLIEVYFREIARLGFKRSLSLDEVINAYYYALSRLRRREAEMKEILKRVIAEEKELETESKEELLP